MRYVRYQRGSIASTIAAALDLSHDAPRYVFATANGYTVATSAPVCQSYYRVLAGDVTHFPYAPWDAQS